MKSAEWFKTQEDTDDNLWHRQEEMSMVTKVLGINSEGLKDKIFWAATDNRVGVIDGGITNYDQLYLRPLIEYEVDLVENVVDYKTIYWKPTVESYSIEDASNTVLYDEDGLYDSWEWERHSSYLTEHNDWESEGKEFEGVTALKTIYPAQGKKGGDTPVIVEGIGPSPEENDIIDDLETLIIEWGDSEYGEDLKEVIKKYKNLPLTEIHDLKETISKGEMEDFAEGRGKGAEKITDSAKEKGGNSMLTYHHFKVKLPYYEKAAEGKFDKEKALKEYKKHLEELYKSTNKEMELTPIKFQELMGRIEVLGELIIKNK